MGFSSTLFAQQFCFTLAESYYEQLYCELKAKGIKRNLPPFYDFQKNNPMTQALILKRPAARLGIEVAMPRKSNGRKKNIFDTLNTEEKTLQSAKIVSPEQDSSTYIKTPGVKQTERERKIQTDHPLYLCELNSLEINCGENVYQLVGNKNNKYLKEDALESSNKLSLEVYNPEVHKNQQLEAYLTNAYRIYIEKMLEIGLGSATLGFQKFVFLFDDMESKGVNFSGRFETMFEFLKKDKRIIAVSETLPDSVKVELEDCLTVNAKVVACQGDRKNYLFVRST